MARGPTGGLNQVPVTVREVRDEQMLDLALVENIQREELTPLEGPMPTSVSTRSST